MKKFLFPLVLIAVYFIAEEFLSLKAGVIVISVLGFGEFIYTRIKEKNSDWLILIMTLLFCLPGIITWTSGMDFPPAIQTVIIEISLIIMLAIPAFTGKSMQSMLPASLRKTIQLSEEQERAIKRLMIILSVIITLHLLLTVFSIFYVEESKQGFINGPLLYILIGVFFAILFIRQRVMARKYRNTEWLPVLDENGKITGRASRELCHSGKKLLHPVIHLHIINSKNEIFLQKRSMKKKLLPGKWDTAVGGHVSFNEKIEDALKRETFEELGITDFEAKFIGNYIWESDMEKELVFSFLSSKYNQININNDEVDEGRFWNTEEIEKGIEDNLLTPNFIHEYRNHLSKINNYEMKHENQ